MWAGPDPGLPYDLARGLESAPSLGSGSKQLRADLGANVEVSAAYGWALLRSAPEPPPLHPPTGSIGLVSQDFIRVSVSKGWEGLNCKLMLIFLTEMSLIEGLVGSESRDFASALESREFLQRQLAHIPPLGKFSPG